MENVSLQLKVLAFAFLVGCSGSDEVETVEDLAPQAAELAKAKGVAQPKAEEIVEPAVEVAPDPALAPPYTAKIHAMSKGCLHNKKKARKGRAVVEGDRLVAKKKGFCQIVRSDGTLLRLGGGGRMTWGSSAKSASHSMKLLLGKLYAWVTPGAKFSVNTAEAVAGVRGTKFFLERKKGDTYLCVCEGEVQASLTGIEGERSVVAGQDLHLRAGKSLGEPTDSPQMSDMVSPIIDAMAK